jgi:hypothetical protein
MSLEQAIPGGMSLEDYLLMREVIAAIREGLPDADRMPPGQVFQHVLERATVRRIVKKRTVLFAPAKLVNDLKGRFYNWIAKSTRNPILHFDFRSAMTDVLSHVRNGVNEARRLFADQKLRVDRSMAPTSTVGFPLTERNRRNGS